MKHLAIAMAFLALTTMPASAWWWGSQPAEEFKELAENHQEEYDELIATFRNLNEKLIDDPDRVKGGLEDLIEMTQDMIDQTGLDGEVRKAKEEATEFYKKRITEAATDEDMTVGHRSELKQRWQQKIVELEDDWRKILERRSRLSELKELYSGELKYRIHLEQLATADELNAALKQLIKKMDESIRQLEQLAPSGV